MFVVIIMNAHQSLHNQLRQQSFRLPLQCQYISAYVLQRAEGLWLIEVPGEADLVAYLDAGRDVPCVGRVGQDLAPQEGLDAALFKERHLLGVAEV